MSDTHDCPGGCGAQVPRHQLACKTDWFRLPLPLRRAINAAYLARGRNPTAHRAALRAAFDWYRANPRGEA